MANSCWHLWPHTECRLRGQIWSYWANIKCYRQRISRRSQFWHQTCSTIWFSCEFEEIQVFGLRRKTAGYVARTAPNDLIFSAICREQRGEADSGLKLAPKFDFHTYLQKFLNFRWTEKRLATWLEQLQMSWFLAEFVENGAEKLILASFFLVFVNAFSKKNLWG